MLLGLVFVGLELRQNTAAVEASTIQSLTDASSSYLLTIASDTELTRIIATASANPNELNELDAARLFFVNRSYWVRMQNAYSQWQRGTLSDDDWALYDAILCNFGEGLDSSSGVIDSFKKHHLILTTEFRKFMEACLDI